MKVRYFTIPNILTLFNLLCGCAAVINALCYEQLQMAFLFVVLGAAFDFSDGLAARLLGRYSPLGKQLDSLADMVTFGIAPSAILFMTMRAAAPEQLTWVAYLAFLVAVFSALRLARFNIDEGQKEVFIGLPTPANALLFASLGYLWAGWADNHPGVTPGGWLLPALAALTLLMSWLLVSPVRMFSLKLADYSLRGNEVRYSFAAAALVGLVIFGIAAVPFIIGLYIVISAAMWLACDGKK